MSELLFELKGLSDLSRASDWLLKMAGDIQVLAFYGDMGAGKTTLIKEICKSIGVQQEVTSPTFALVNEYKTANQNTIYHFDFYRLEEPVEALDIGFEDYLATGFKCMIEWPEKIGAYLPEDCLKINIDVRVDNIRLIQLIFPA